MTAKLGVIPLHVDQQQGTVTSVSVVSTNGFAGSVATATTTPAITLSVTFSGLAKANGTAISAATAGTDYTTPTGTENLSNKTITGGTINNTPIGGTTANTGAFTTVTTPIVRAPTAGNVDIKAPNGTTIGVFNGSSGLFTAPFSLFWGGYMESIEATAPAAPAANGVRIFAQDNGAGKTQLMALFNTGAAQQIAIQP